MLNNNKRHGDIFNFAPYALFYIRFLRQMWTPKTEGKDEANRVQITLFRPLGAIFEEGIGKLSGCRSCFKSVICIMQALHRQLMDIHLVFLQVNFALNARVSQSSHFMILRTQAENKVFPQSAVFFIKLVQFSNRPFSGIELLLTFR